MNLPTDRMTTGLLDAPGTELFGVGLAIGDWPASECPPDRDASVGEQAEADDPFDDFEEDDFDDEFDDDFEEDWEDDLTQDDEFPDTFGGQDVEVEPVEEESTTDSPFQEDPDFDE